MPATTAVDQIERMLHARAVVEGGRRKRWLRRKGTKARGFWYENAEGRRITEEAQLERIRKLTIPPAWRSVRISPVARGKLQAVGIDTNGRVQYLYSADFAARRQRLKYSRIEQFGNMLPRIRRVTNEDMSRNGLPREKVLAVMVRLIDDLHFRVGSEESVRRYRTFGITTLRNHHVRIGANGALEFNFVGKHHIRLRRVLLDKDLAGLVSDIKSVKGSKLFNYIGDDGKPHAVKPVDLNRYVKEAMGPEFSVKDFRTWAGTVAAAVALAELGPAATQKQLKKNVVQAVKRVAEELGNTPTVCRSCYIHPVLFERYAAGITLSAFRKRAERRLRRRHQPDYDPEEAALLDLLKAEPTTLSEPEKLAA